MVKTVVREIDTMMPVLRDSHDGSAEAVRQLTMAVTDLRLVANRTSVSVAAKFGQMLMVDTTKDALDVTLPSATLDDIGRTVTIKLWSGSPAGIVTIRAPLDGNIDGNTSWKLNMAMECVTISYMGNNEWVIVSHVPGVGGLLLAVI